MDKQRAQRRQRVASKVIDLTAARQSEERVVGGDTKKPTPTTTKPETYLTITLENTMISG